jgi:hypothetical protein
MRRLPDDIIEYTDTQIVVMHPLWEIHQTACIKRLSLLLSLSEALPASD